MNPTRDAPERATGLVLVAAFLFGTTGTALGRFEPDASPNGVSALRLLIGAGTLIVVAVAGGARPRSLHGHGGWLALGALAVAGYQMCFFIGTTRTGVALATVATIGSGPVFAGLIDLLAYRRVPTLGWLTGTALGIVGIVLLVGSQPTDQVDALGVLAALGSGFGWAVYASIGKVCIARGLDSSACMAALFAGGAVLLGPFLFVDDLGWASTGTGLALALYLGVVTVGVAYTCYGRGLRVLPAPTVITLTLAEPITAAVLASVVLHEDIDALGWVGIALVLVALVVTARAGAITVARRRRRAAAAGRPLR